MNAVPGDRPPPEGVEAARRVGPWRTELARAVELVGIFGLAIAQPTFDVLGKNASLFVAWRATPKRSYLLVAAVVLLPPMVAYAMEVLVGIIVPRARRWVHAALLGLGVGIIATEVSKHAGSLGAGVAFAIGAAAAVGAGVLFARVHALRVWSRLLALAPVAFAALLLWGSPATVVIFGSDPGPAAVSVEHPARVVMIVLDEFPVASLLDGTGAIDASLYPNFAALADDGTWYRNTMTVAQVTESAVPAILTGMLPGAGDPAPVVAEHPHSLFTLLGARYRMNVHESVTRLCPTSLCPVGRPLLGVHAGARGMIRDAVSIWSDFANPAKESTPVFNLRFGLDFHALDTADGFVSTLRPSGSRPRLDFLHVLLPHFPWHYLSTGQDDASLPGHTNGLVGQDWPDNDVAALARLQHVLQVQATDAFVGRVVARLRALDEYDTSLIVVTADHGVAFTGGAPMRVITAATVPDIAFTPLFIKAPRQVIGAIDDRAAESIDVLPTIADHLGIDLPWKVDGRSLLGAARRTQTSLMAPKFHGVPGRMPAGDDGYLHLDRTAGFAEVLGRRAAADGPIAEERPFRLGPYGDLVGRETAPLVAGADPAQTVTLDVPLRYRQVQRSSPFAAYADFHGWTSMRDAGQPLAVSVNGRIAGLSFTYRAPGSSRVEFWGVLSPRRFHDGANEVEVYRVDGPPGAARLALLPESNAAVSGSSR